MRKLVPRYKGGRKIGDTSTTTIDTYLDKNGRMFIHSNGTFVPTQETYKMITGLDFVGDSFDNKDKYYSKFSQDANDYTYIPANSQLNMYDLNLWKLVNKGQQTQEKSMPVLYQTAQASVTSSQPSLQLQSIQTNTLSNTQPTTNGQPATTQNNTEGVQTGWFADTLSKIMPISSGNKTDEKGRWKDIFGRTWATDPNDYLYWALRDAQRKVDENDRAVAYGLYKTIEAPINMTNLGGGIEAMRRLYNGEDWQAVGKDWVLGNAKLNTGTALDGLNYVDGFTWTGVGGSGLKALGEQGVKYATSDLARKEAYNTFKNQLTRTVTTMKNHPEWYAAVAARDFRNNAVKGAVSNIKNDAYNYATDLSAQAVGLNPEDVHIRYPNIKKQQNSTLVGMITPIDEGNVNGTQFGKYSYSFGKDTILSK